MVSHRVRYHCERESVCVQNTSGFIAAPIPNPGSNCRWAINCTPQPLYSLGKCLQYPPNRRLGGPQSRVGHFGEDSSCAAGIWKIPWSSTVWPGDTDGAVPGHTDHHKNFSCHWSTWFKNWWQHIGGWAGFLSFFLGGSYRFWYKLSCCGIDYFKWKLYFVNVHLFTKCAYTHLASSCTRWSVLVLLVQEETVLFPYARILKIFCIHSSVRLARLYPRMVQFPYSLEPEDWIACIFIPAIISEMPVRPYPVTFLKCQYVRTL